ncbi:hypothetical protein RZS08_11015, partial [Arthrospira platensis SPKY1]|nr:hypothetical protein [Arthrospira platensis SPKY1]
MKVTKEQLDEINEMLLIQDKIHDENIRLELVDHIASIIEEEGKSFDDSFSAFWNSHKKISLISSAKEQIRIKDVQIESFFWSTLFKPVYMTLLFACSLISFYLSLKWNAFPEIFDAILFTLMALVLIAFFVIKFIKIQAFTYTKN